MPPPPPPLEGGIPAPFADRQGRGFFGALFQTWKLVAIEPQKFFTHVRIQVGSAILFGVLLAWLGNAIGGLLTLGLRLSSLGEVERSLSGLPPEQAEHFRELMEKVAVFMTPRFAIGSIIASPLGTLVYMFVVAGVVHLLLMMFRGARRGFEATLLVVAYSCGLHLFNAVPEIGPLVGLVWQVVVLVIGLAAIHRTSTGKSAAAVLVPGVLCCCCVCLGLVGAFVSIVSAIGGAAGGTSNL